MKQIFRRTAAAFLALSVLIPSALASYALGDELHQNTIPLSDGASLTKQLIWSSSKSDLRREHYVTYTPRQDLRPQVYYGGTVLTKQSVGTMAKQLEQGGKRVLSGTNGDYFDMGTGNPLGLLVTDGVLRSSASYLSALGFTANGSAIIGTPNLNIEATFSGNTMKVEGINKTRTANGYYLYNSDYGSATNNTEAGIDVILRPLNENIGTTITLSDGRSVTQSSVLRIGGRMSFEVEEVLQSSGKVSIPAGKYIMSINNKGGEWVTSTLAALKPGDTMDISITSADTRWNDVQEALGAMYRILTDGTVASGIGDGSSNASRTAVGIKADGSVIFYTIDGRQSGYSIGASISQVAERLKELGCVNAVCLDGGGSTTLGATLPDSSQFTIMNQPSEGSQRSVTNALFLVSTHTAVGGAAHIFVTPTDEVLAGGASTSIRTSFVDQNWFPGSSSEPIYFTAQLGSVSAEGIYTAPRETCVDTITAHTDSGLTGSASVTVFEAPNAIRIRNAAGQTVSALSLDAGGSISLTASATYQTIPLKTDGQSLTWSVTPASLGSITPEGLLTVSAAGGSGQLSVSSGSHSASIPLTVSADARYRLLDPFESESGREAMAIRGAVVSMERMGDQVCFGEASLRWSYELSAGASSLAVSASLQNSERYLSLWVYGDGSGGTLDALLLDAEGNASSASFGALNHSGWKQLFAPLPAGSTALTALSFGGGSKTSGTLWLDQLCAANTTEKDTTPPTVTLTLNGSSLQAQISDNSDQSFAQDQLILTRNGQAQPFTFDASANRLSATLSASEVSLQRITVQAIDQSGNIGRASRTLVGEGAATSFSDMGGHWAVSYTDALSSLGIISGMPEGGKLYFNPNLSITRGDFALMAARWMGLDFSLYADVVLPFADKADIPKWSENAVKAMYELGIMKGVSDRGGLYAYARADITRQEAMTILGRIQMKGYAGKSLDQFKDSSAIASWAAPYVRSLVGQEAVGGYTDGFMRPQNPVSRAEVAKILFSIW